LCFGAESVVADATARRHDAVTGDDERDRIVREHVADCTDSAGTSRLARDPFVGPHFSAGNPLDDREDFLLEIAGVAAPVDSRPGDALAGEGVRYLFVQSGRQCPGTERAAIAPRVGGAKIVERASAMEKAQAVRA